MADRDEMRALFRRVLDAGGDIVDVALAARLHGWGSGSTRAAAALREEFGVSITEALNFAAWIEGDGDDENSRAQLRASVPTVLR